MKICFQIKIAFPEHCYIKLKYITIEETIIIYQIKIGNPTINNELQRLLSSLYLRKKYEKMQL